MNSQFRSRRWPHYIFLVIAIAFMLQGKKICILKDKEEPKAASPEQLMGAGNAYVTDPSDDRDSAKYCSAPDKYLYWWCSYPTHMDLDGTVIYENIYPAGAGDLRFVMDGYRYAAHTRYPFDRLYPPSVDQFGGHVHMTANLHGILYLRDFGIDHWGIDLAAAENTIVYAPGPGKVVFYNDNPNHSCGIFLVIDHRGYPGGPNFTIYCHLNYPLVGSQANVSLGQKIARSGQTGSVNGAHLHYAMCYTYEKLDAGFKSSCRHPLEWSWY